MLKLVSAPREPIHRGGDEDTDTDPSAAKNTDEPVFLTGGKQVCRLRDQSSSEQYLVDPFEENTAVLNTVRG